MSHITRMKLEIHDLGVLGAACKRLGLELMQGQTKCKLWLRDVSCLHAIRIPGDTEATEIAVVKNGAGFGLDFDFYGSKGVKMRQIVGHDGNLLVQAYAIERAKKEAFLLGHTTREEVAPNGHIRLFVQAGA